MGLLFALIFTAVVSNNVETCLKQDINTMSAKDKEYCEQLKNNDMDAGDFIVIDTIPNFSTIGM